jgi:hypothetical protein
VLPDALDWLVKISTAAVRCRPDVTMLARSDTRAASGFERPWRAKPIKIGVKVFSHGRYLIFQVADVRVSRQMFQ